ncbi:42661_t:CDS:1, partial [Gigaspora margarita]
LNDIDEDQYNNEHPFKKQHNPQTTVSDPLTLILNSGHHTVFNNSKSSSPSLNRNQMQLQAQQTKQSAPESNIAITHLDNQ